MINYESKFEENILTITINSNQPLLLDKIHKHIKILLTPYKNHKQTTIKFNPEYIIQTCCNYFNIPVQELFIKCRQKELVNRKHTIFYFLYLYSNENVYSIARRYKKVYSAFNHANIYSAYVKINNYILEPLIGQYVLDIKNLLIPNQNEEV